MVVVREMVRVFARLLLRIMVFEVIMMVMALIVIEIFLNLPSTLKPLTSSSFLYLKSDICQVPKAGKCDPDLPQFIKKLPSQSSREYPSQKY